MRFRQPPPELARILDDREGFAEMFEQAGEVAQERMQPHCPWCLVYRGGQCTCGVDLVEAARAP